MQLGIINGERIMINIIKKKIDKDEYKYTMEIRNSDGEVTYRDNFTIGRGSEKECEQIAKNVLLRNLLRNGDIDNVLSLTELIPVYNEE